jgi:hypothetical protein
LAIAIKSFAIPILEHKTDVSDIEKKSTYSEIGTRWERKFLLSGKERYKKDGVVFQAVQGNKTNPAQYFSTHCTIPKLFFFIFLTK